MKEIKAIIQPHMLSKVIRELHELPHFPGFTVSDVRGQGRGRGAGGAFKVTEDSIDYHRKLQLCIVCADEAQARITDAIQRAAHTGNPGDGIIIVSEMCEVIRIRSGEKQEQAV
jgi:nitrogen regulatory protein P-II 1